MNDENPDGSGENWATAPTKLVPKKGPHSVVWKYFGFKQDGDNQSEVHCKMCFVPVAAKQGNTTNLFSHLKRHHKVQYNETVQSKNSENACYPKKQNITATIHNAIQYPPNSSRHKEITAAISYHLAKDMAPINTAEHVGFRNTLDKRYSMPSCNYFSKIALPAMYKEQRAIVEAELREVDSFSATSDLWSSQTMEPYMSLTVHLVATDFTMKSRCLQTAFFPEDHTSEALAHGLKETLASWSLEEEKMACTTTDNGQNIVKAVSINNWT